MLSAQDSIGRHRLQNLALIILSLIFLPLNTFILCWSLLSNAIFKTDVSKKRYARRHSPEFKQKTILVTGVGMTKGLVLARSFYKAGHKVIGADFEASGTRVSGRVSKSLDAFVPLAKPNAKEGSAPYIQSLLKIVEKYDVDLWVSCSGVASAVEDGEAKEIVERRTSCKAIQFDVANTKTLHEKDSFIDRTRSIGLKVPETITVTSRKDVEGALKNAPAGRQYIMKTIGMDDLNRGDMTLLPKPTQQETNNHLSKLRISKQSPWILQQFIQGREFCTHALVIRGHVKVFVSCPSAELLMHYSALPWESKLNQRMLEFTRTYAAESGSDFTGHLSFDFLVEDEQLDELRSDPEAQVDLYPIECNPRAHTAVVLFNDTNEMAEAYLTLLEDHEAPPSYAEAAANGTQHEHIVQPMFSEKQYYWIGHDLVNHLVLPLLAFLTRSADGSLTRVFRGSDKLVEHLLFWNDGTYVSWDPWPYWWLYHVYWPWQFFLCLITGKKWSRVNVSTCKMFEC